MCSHSVPRATLAVQLRRSHVPAATLSSLAHAVTRGPLGAQRRASACTEGYTKPQHDLPARDAHTTRPYQLDGRLELGPGQQKAQALHPIVLRPSRIVTDVPMHQLKPRLLQHPCGADVLR